MHVAGTLQEGAIHVVPRPPGRAGWEGGGRLPGTLRFLPAPCHLSSSFHDSNWEKHFLQSSLLSGEAFFFLTPQVKQKFMPLKGKRQILARLADYLFAGQ